MKETRTRERGTPHCPAGHKQKQTSGCREEKHTQDARGIYSGSYSIGEWAKKTQKKRKGKGQYRRTGQEKGSGDDKMEQVPPQGTNTWLQ